MPVVSISGPCSERPFLVEGPYGTQLIPSSVVSLLGARPNKPNDLGGSLGLTGFRSNFKIFLVRG